MENKKTLWYVGIAVGLSLIAWAMTPSRITPDAFLDQGEQFFENFTDPNSATSLEVVEFDEATGSARPFKVSFDNGRWVIPSHNNYPADAEERLAKTAAGVIGIKKDDFRTDVVADHPACGVVDPLDETASLAGRGQRITLKAASGEVLADFVVGKEVPGRPGFRFVRVPDQKRVYACRMDLELSTQFGDWINTDLLKVTAANVDRVLISDYSINEQTRRVNNRDKFSINRKDNIWTTSGMSSTQMIDTTKMELLLRTLDELAIVDVRPKSESLSKSLAEGLGDASISQQEAHALQNKGYYFTRDGKLLSNEGEIQCRTVDGVLYTLRFGEILYGSGLSLTAGTDNVNEQQGSSENRYLFITAELDRSALPEPKRPSGNRDYESKPDSLWTDQDRETKRQVDIHTNWENGLATAQKLVDQLNGRFAKWYYVISADSFDKLHLTRKDLVISKG